MGSIQTLTASTTGVGAISSTKDMQGNIHLLYIDRVPGWYYDQVFHKQLSSSGWQPAELVNQINVNQSLPVAISSKSLPQLGYMGTYSQGSSTYFVDNATNIPATTSQKSQMIL